MMPECSYIGGEKLLENFDPRVQSRLQSKGMAQKSTACDLSNYSL